MTSLGVRFPDDVDHSKMDPPPEYYDVETRRSIGNVDDQIRTTIIELEESKQEYLKIKAFNKNLETKINEADADRKSLQTKLDSLKAKLAVSNANVTKFNDEKESLQTSLNESQVLVARLEERLTATSSELDRLRDPANPESNFSIRKHVVNDKKEIKKLKADHETEIANLDNDKATATQRDSEIKKLEKELSRLQEQLRTCQEDRAKALEDEIAERKKKEEIIQNYRQIKEDKKSYEQKLKDARIQLGVKVSGRNVNVKLAEEMKVNEKKQQKQLNSIEKRLKDALADLDILKNQHKMSKTAMSINKYTKRNKDKEKNGGGSTGSGDSRVSVALTGTGPVRFVTKSKKSLDAAAGSVTDRPKKQSDGVKDKAAGSQTDRPGQKGHSIQNLPSKQDSIGKGDHRNSVQFVPPPKAKLKGV
ncbi:interaptin-like isoform X1 [Dreissena polymorpha]|uniref:Uncharacterized protein n=1 Tax=Dreissena polymorpha TaxID=45954 RepID=A0A9D4J1D4_DREPO|nr:interaptin-like isoform X1 [Dreissena polymorpha]XP_052222084.1 interaptin-like isoform X1 [Dreissena polymorpha]KAH3792138.1 hypothetical protein DPMN_145629 [Dreissena polymorpha]